MRCKESVSSLTPLLSPDLGLAFKVLDSLFENQFLKSIKNSNELKTKNKLLEKKINF